MAHESIRIRSVQEVGPDTIALELESPADFDARPGQFVKLTAFVEGEHVVRFYTISSPDAIETFEVTVGIEPDGTLGPWLRTAPNETVEIEGPYGTAAYDGEPSVLILAGGPGIGAAVGVAERAEALGHEAKIIYRGEHPAHVERVRALERDGAEVALTGDIEAAIGESLTGDEQVFVYGFQEFVTDALAAIDAAGGDVDDAKVENYG